MLIRRREFVASALTGLVGSSFPASALVPGSGASVDPREFGARFDGRSDDTDAWQSAIDFAAARGLTVAPRRAGTSLLVCKPVPRATYGNSPETRVYQAVDINRSGLRIDFGGARLRIRGHGQTKCVNYAFGTAKNLAPGTVSGLRFANGILDFDPSGDRSINKRAFHLVGVDDVEISDLLLTSTGPRAGATITLQNCRRVKMRNIQGVNITQGMNLSYVDDVELDRLAFDNFSEAIDCDRRVRRMIARTLTFANGGPNNQCIDLNSVEDVLISGIDAKDVGNIALVNYKITTPPTYRDYVSNAAVTHYSPSRNVTIEHVRGQRICYPASTTIPLRLGNDQRRSDESSYPSENITLRHIALSQCPSFIPIELVRNAVLEDIVFDGALNPNPDMGCIDIRGDLFGTSATLRNVRVAMAHRGTRGIRSNGPASLRLEDVTVSGSSTPGAIFFEFTALDQHQAVIRLDRVAAVATSGAGAVAFRLGDGGTGRKYSVTMGPDVRARGAFARRLVLNGWAARRVKTR
jgi:hypothetical protein